MKVSFFETVRYCAPEALSPEWPVPSGSYDRDAGARALGSDGLRQAFAYLAQADIDLKGARAIPEDAVMEVLVARLAHLSGRARGARRR